MKELLGMIIRKDDPEIGLQGLQPVADFSRYPADPLDRVAILGFGHREELRGMGKHRATNNAWGDYAAVKGSALHY